MWVVVKKMSGVNANSLLSPKPRIRISSKPFGSRRLSFFSDGVLASSAAVVNPSRSSEERVYEVVLKQAALVREPKRDIQRALDWEKTIENEGITDGNLLSEAYSRCGEVCAEYAKTFYLGKLFPLSYSFHFWVECFCFCHAVYRVPLQFVLLPFFEI